MDLKRYQGMSRLDFFDDDTPLKELACEGIYIPFSDITIHQGKAILLVGECASGKTTLARRLNDGSLEGFPINDSPTLHRKGGKIFTYPHRMRHNQVDLTFLLEQTEPIPIEAVIFTAYRYSTTDLFDPVEAARIMAECYYEERTWNPLMEDFKAFLENLPGITLNKDSDQQFGEYRAEQARKFVDSL